MKRVLAILAAGLASACVSIEVEDASPVYTDATLRALQSAAPQECPASQVQEDARDTGPSAAVGISEAMMASAPLSGANQGQAVRMRRIIIAPGGVIPWHNHDGRQGMGMIVSGEMTEYNNQCRAPIRRGPGSISREIAGLAHYWRNESDAPAVLIATDVVPVEMLSP